MKGRAGGTILIGLLIAGLLCTLSLQKNGYPLDEGVGAISLGIYLLYISSLFFFSYRSPDANFVFQAIAILCRRFVFPATPAMAIVLGGIVAFSGAMAVAAGITDIWGPGP